MDSTSKTGTRQPLNARTANPFNATTRDGRPLAPSVIDRATRTPQASGFGSKQSSVLRDKGADTIGSRSPRGVQSPRTGHGGRTGTGTSADITFGRWGNRGGGLIHLGRHDDRFSLSATLLLNRHRHHRHVRHHGFGIGHYYRGYSPICYTTRYRHHGFYDPWWRYSYASVYYPQPVVYEYYNNHTYYVYDDAPASGVVYDGEARYYESQSNESTAWAPDEGTAWAPHDESAMRVAPTDAMGSPPVEVPVDTGYEYDDIQTGVALSPVELGNQAFLSGDYVEAKRQYIQATLADERDGYAKFLYALAHFATGDFEVAAVALRRALLTTDLLIERPLDMRMLYDEPVRFDRQMNALVRHVDNNPQDVSAHFVLAYTYYAIGQPQPAAAMFTRMASEDSNDTLAARLAEVAGKANPVEPAPQ